MDKKIILKLQFTDAVTGQLVTANIAQESWDRLTVIMEQKLADFYKNNGLKKDLGGV